MTYRPMSIKVVFWIQIIGLAYYGAYILLAGSFFIPGGSVWEGFKDGFLGSRLGISASEFNEAHFGKLIGSIFIPVCLVILSLYSIKNQWFKTIVTSTIFHLVLTISTQPLSVVPLIITLILILTNSSRRHLRAQYSYEHEASSNRS
ncbi:hypothetical protein [Paenibacillus taiwanensis]|uniref:hypothetical protein n=1 Tax=Paenibacillus taiwanensis TaxID=401638 RepID=UPI00048C51EB|nr:hypothetical protein [Paenibacillus taiwanensis]